MHLFLPVFSEILYFFSPSIFAPKHRDEAMEGLLLVPPERGTIIGRAVWKVSHRMRSYPKILTDLELSTVSLCCSRICLSPADPSRNVAPHDIFYTTSFCSQRLKVFCIIQRAATKLCEHESARVGRTLAFNLQAKGSSSRQLKLQRGVLTDLPGRLRLSCTSTD